MLGYGRGKKEKHSCAYFSLEDDFPEKQIKKFII